MNATTCSSTDDDPFIFDGVPEANLLSTLMYWSFAINSSANFFVFLFVSEKFRRNLANNLAEVFTRAEGRGGGGGGGGGRGGGGGGRGGGGEGGEGTGRLGGGRRYDNSNSCNTSMINLNVINNTTKESVTV